MSYDVLRQGAQPLAHRPVLTALAHPGHGELHQVGGLVDVTAGEGVPDGVGQAVVLGVPVRGVVVQAPDVLGAPGRESRAQRLREEVVVAPPLPLVVERDHEEVRPLQRLQQLLAVGAASDRVAQRPAQVVEDGGVEQERPDVRGLAGEHLVDEVVEDEPVAPGERLDEAVRVGRAGGGEGGELQARGPSLGTPLERDDVLRLQAEPHDVVEERRRLGRGEPEVCGADLEQVPAGPEPRQGQWWIGPRRHRHGDLRWQVVEQEGDRLVHLGAVDDVVVVERDHRRPGQRVELLDQAGQHVLRPHGPLVLEQRRRVGADLRAGDADGRHEVREEPPQVGVRGVERQPGGPDVTGRQPLGQQRRLPGPRRCRHQHEPRHRAPAGRQPVREAAAVHELAS